MHGDLYNHVTLATPGGQCYFLHLVDDLSCYMWVVLLDTKSVAVDAIKRFQATLEKEYGRKLRVLRTDNGGEFMVAEIAAYHTTKGSNATTPRHTPRSRMMSLKTITK